MITDISGLDLLPETEPLPLADLDGVGLMRCQISTCVYVTCGWSGFTCFITDW